MALIAETTRIEGTLDADERPEADRRREERVDVALERGVGGEVGRGEDELERDDVHGGMHACVGAGCASESDLMERMSS